MKSEKDRFRFRTCEGLGKFRGIGCKLSKSIGTLELKNHISNKANHSRVNLLKRAKEYHPEFVFNLNNRKVHF